MKIDGRCSTPLHGKGSTALQSNAIAAIGASVSFLDALALEVLAEAALQTGGHLSATPADVRSEIVKLAEKKRFSHRGVREKWKALFKAAELADAQDMAVDDLIAIRNRLTHYEQGWLDIAWPAERLPGNALATDELMKRIHAYFPPSRRTPFSSNSWLGPGCAHWAALTALSYADEFYAGLGVVPIYDHVRPRRLDS